MNHTKIIQMILLFGSLSLFSPLGSASVLEGTTVGVSDGDTVTILDNEKSQHKVRISGIDAPEKGQPFGIKSKENLSKFIYGKHVRVEWTKIDRYNRIIGKIRIKCNETDCPSINDAGLMQINSGYAWHYKQYASEQTQDDRIAYAKSESLARSRRIGLWQDNDPLAPWDFRRLKK